MRRKIKKIILLIAIFLFVALISCGIYFLFKELNITNIKSLRSFISKYGVLSPIVFIVCQILISTLIFVVPFEDELWVSLSILLFGAKEGFVYSTISILLISAILYFFGNKLGVKLVSKFIDEKTLNDMQEKLKVKGGMSLPFIYLIPFIPHDALCVGAGMIKMNFWYFLLVTTLLRPLEILAICFLGGELIDWKSLSKFDWLVIVNLIVVDLFLMKKLALKMEEIISKKKNKIENKIEK